MQPRVLIRIGNGKPIEQTWTRIKSLFGTTILAPQNPIGLLNKMLESDKLVLRTLDDNYGDTAVFDLSGLDKAIAPISANCDW